MSSAGRGRYLGVDDAPDDTGFGNCHWCQRCMADGGYGIEGYTFCDAQCADEWWQEWCGDAEA